MVPPTLSADVSQDPAMTTFSTTALPLHRGAGLTASTRASAYLYNTTEDIDAFLAALAEVRPYFGL